MFLMASSIQVGGKIEQRAGLEKATFRPLVKRRPAA
jgi:hypothetical protein